MRKLPPVPGSREALVQANAALRNKVRELESRVQLAENECRVMAGRLRVVENEADVLGRMVMSTYGIEEAPW